MKTRVFAIIHEQEKFLLIRETNIRFKNQWYLPGGTLETNEDLTIGLIREVKEEAGFEVGVNGIFFIRHLSLPVARKGLYVYCSARTIQGELKTNADEHSIEAQWFARNEILKLDARDNLLEIIQHYDDQLPLLPTGQFQLSHQMIL